MRRDLQAGVGGSAVGERVAVLTVDEVSVLIGILDGKLNRSGRADSQMGELAARYQRLLWDRLMYIPDIRAEAVDSLMARVATAQHESERAREQLRETLGESQDLRSRQEDLRSACHAALQLVGDDGPLEGRACDDPDLCEVRSVLATVVAV